ncbi:MAG: hypothetical protein ABMA26_23810 [Limisphaerales bacterium]
MIRVFAKPAFAQLMRFFALMLICSATIVACKRKPAAPPPPAPAFDPSAATKEPTLDELNQAVQAWFTSRGQAPASLEELAKARFISRVPTPPPGRQYVIDKENLRVVVK